MLLPTLIFLAIVIIFHELGHFLACKLLGIRVEVFSFGFPPKLISKKFGQTEYVISAIPLGGYVKIAGQDPTEHTGAPEEFLSHPLWHRSLVVVAGPLFNILIALVLTYILLVVGTEMSTFSNKIGLVDSHSLAEQAGLRPGDKIIAIDGKEIKYWHELGALYEQKSEVRNQKSEVQITIDRAGNKLDLMLPLFNQKTAGFDLETDYGFRRYVPYSYVEVEMVTPNSIAYRAGLRQGDRILAISTIDGATTFHRIIEGIHNSRAQQIILTIQRQETIFPMPVIPEFATKDAKYATIGFIPQSPVKVVIRHSPIESIGLTFRTIGRFTYLSGTMLVEVFTGKIPFSKVFGGPQAIAIVVGQQAKLGLTPYLFMVAILSLQLGVINLIPFPVLDGGHLLFYAIEKIRKKPLSIKTLEYVTRFGVAVLITLMLYIIINDLMMSGTLSKYF
ncbi:MAG: RIP metalloprotease RseP [bacterium]|nr:RIP metalloprotease RseP [bacterium]